MLAQSEYVGQYHQQRKIQKQVGQDFGYKVNNGPFDLTKSLSVLRDSMPKINTRINPLVVKRQTMKPSDRLKELNDEMRHIEMQKRMSQIADQDNLQLNIIDMLNEKIRQYNYIVDHKHITAAKEDIQIEQRLNGKEIVSETQRLVERIKGKNREFMREKRSLNQEEKKSKQITALYQSFSKRIIESPIKNRVKSYKKRNTKSVLLQKINKKQSDYKNGDQNIKLNRAGSSCIEQREEDINIREPYISNQYINTSKRIERQCKTNRASLEVWKHRMELLTNKQPNFSTHKNQSQQLASKAKSDIDDIDDMETRVPSELKSYEYFGQNGNPEEKQKNRRLLILSSHLEKKNSRYFKVPGNKFLSKFDSNLMAKSMLEGISADKQKPEPLPKGLKNMHSRKLKVPDDMDQNSKYVMKMMIEAEDDMFYWTASRNQKINLLLKGKKHS